METKETDEAINGEVVHDLAKIPEIAGVGVEEIDRQIATARRFPRSLTDFKRKLLTMATIDAETAASMYYVIPRGGKNIDGPSIRMAEVAAAAYGNMRYGGRVIEVGAAYVTAEGFAWDLENNVAVTTQIRRRIVDSKNRRYNEDMITMTGNAAAAIAQRNANLKIVPRALLNDVYQEAMKVSLGKGLTIEQQRTKAIKAFEQWKLTEADILKIMKKAGLDDLAVKDIIDLRGIYTALLEKHITVAELLAETEDPKPPEPEAPKTSKTEALAKKLSKKKEEPAPEPQVPAQTMPAHEESTVENTVTGIPQIVLGGKTKAGLPKKVLMFDPRPENSYTTTNEEYFMPLQNAQEQKVTVRLTWKSSEEFGREIVTLEF